MSPSFPPIHALLPHSGPMRLLDRVLAHDASETRCAVDPARSFLFQDPDAPAGVPVWVALEYMAQCAGVHGSLRARGRGEAPPRAWLAGSRRLAFGCDAFPTDAELEVTARPVGASGGGVAFDCRVRALGGETVLAEGRLLVARLDTREAEPHGARSGAATSGAGSL